jgi:hypothetical protein
MTQDIGTALKTVQTKQSWKRFLDEIGSNGLFASIHKWNYMSLRGAAGNTVITYERVLEFHTIGLADIASQKSFVMACKVFLSPGVDNWIMLPNASSSETIVSIIQNALSAWPVEPAEQDKILEMI